MLSDAGGVLGGGFAVATHGLYKLIYREDDHTIEVGMEPLKGGAGKLIYLLGVTKWAPPHESEVLTPEEIYKIRSNVMDALKFLRIKFDSNWLPNSSSRPIE
ncbi:MAG TPA: hypothetical protein VNK23_06210 [Candidatus Dormibacteraeota bacterium]|nr:hypothetical protein [Candidatus Dormibacteraeota bacterium]